MGIPKYLNGSILCLKPSNLNKCCQLRVTFEKIIELLDYSLVSQRRRKTCWSLWLLYSLISDFPLWIKEYRLQTLGGSVTLPHWLCMCLYCHFLLLHGAPVRGFQAPVWTARGIEDPPCLKPWPLLNSYYGSPSIRTENDGVVTHCITIDMKLPGKPSE